MFLAMSWRGSKGRARHSKQEWIERRQSPLNEHSVGAAPYDDTV
jgi:hypothetical protein